MTPQLFQRRFMSYILLAWTLPPVLGLAFILFIHLLTPGQVARILTAPLEPAFILGTLVFALMYFQRFIRPIRDYLA
ncbi:MAG TPA: hypothetical protein VK971_10565, partial [Thiohalobacter sp.]|nr:hypothetical protein [Thiohalobacter sp.]